MWGEDDNNKGKDKNKNSNNIINEIESPSTTSTSTTTSTPTSTPTTHHDEYKTNTSTNHHRYNKNKNKKYNNNYNKHPKGNDNDNRSQQHSQHSQHHHQRKQQPKQQNEKNHHQRPDNLQGYRFGSPNKLIDFVGGVNYTPSIDNGVIFNRVVKFFRNLTKEIEKKKRLLDFNFRLQENQSGFFVRIIPTDPERHPPYETLNCLSCDKESETNKISKLPYPTTTRDEVSIHHNLWIDAKARPMFIITPKRHVERLSECSDQEIFSMFLLATQIIEQETRLSNAEWTGIKFRRMTLNHGNSRNLKHLHLKIRIDNKEFDHFKKFWDKEREEKFEILKSGLYRRDERLTKISKID